MVSSPVLSVPRSASTAWWGMLLLVATEAALFAVLIASYFYLRFHADGGWPPEGIDDPKLVRASLMTSVLLASSVPMALAEAGIARGDRRRLRAGLAASFGLGALFLGLQALEYREQLRELRPQTDAYGSLVYTITGAHAAHVALGLALLAWLQLHAWLGAYGPRRHVAVQVIALYWHFVTLASTVVFATVYLSPRV